MAGRSLTVPNCPFGSLPRRAEGRSRCLLPCVLADVAYPASCLLAPRVARRNGGVLGGEAALGYGGCVGVVIGEVVAVAAIVGGAGFDHDADRAVAGGQWQG